MRKYKLSSDQGKVQRHLSAIRRTVVDIENKLDTTVIENYEQLIKELNEIETKIADVECFYTD